MTATTLRYETQKSSEKGLFVLVVEVAVATLLVLRNFIVVTRARRLSGRFAVGSMQFQVSRTSNMLCTYVQNTSQGRSRRVRANIYISHDL